MHRANVTGSLWMVAAMAGFAVEDALLKQAAVSLPLAQVMVMFGAGGAVVFAVWAALTGARLIRPEVLSRPMRLRAVCEVCGRLFYTLAIVLTPLSSATAILQATPIVVEHEKIAKAPGPARRRRCPTAHGRSASSTARARRRPPRRTPADGPASSRPSSAAAAAS